MPPVLRISVLVCLAVAACAPAPEDIRDPWRESIAALPAAKAGDAEGLQRTFAAARAQLMQPYINGGEDAETMFLNMGEVLRSTGDERFHQVLLAEAPETRSAVRDFLSEDDTRRDYPKTHALLADAPEVEWPSDLAMKKSYQESGGTPPVKAPWKK
ncbi:MAG: hypothetical protein EOP83_21450 [Verrucomicrobiaceae bacterium]|nr:MAG: hypothetical protein EOP83_21450 [Verrucomicrobiaceae bacterium]